MARVTNSIYFGLNNCMHGELLQGQDYSGLQVVKGFGLGSIGDVGSFPVLPSLYPISLSRRQSSTSHQTLIMHGT